MSIFIENLENSKGDIFQICFQLGRREGFMIIIIVGINKAYY